MWAENVLIYKGLVSISRFFPGDRIKNDLFFKGFILIPVINWIVWFYLISWILCLYLCFLFLFFHEYLDP